MAKKKTNIKQISKFDGKLIKLFTRRERLPNGRQINLEMIEHPGAVLIVPFLDKECIVMLRQYRAVIGKYIYELPAGTLGKNEKHLVCARRELMEETGYSAATMTKIGEIYPAPGYTTEKIVIFRAQDLQKNAASPEKDEIITEKILTLTQIRRLFKEKKIVDAKTICALAFCGLF